MPVNIQKRMVNILFCIIFFTSYVTSDLQVLWGGASQGALKAPDFLVCVVLGAIVDLEKSGQQEFVRRKK